MVPHVFSVTRGESVVCDGELSFDGLGDVRDLSVSVEGNQLTRLSGEHPGVHGLGAKLQSGGYLTTCLRSYIYHTMRRPHTAIEVAYYEIVYTCVRQTHGKWPSVAVGRVDCLSASGLS